MISILMKSLSEASETESSCSEDNFECCAQTAVSTRKRKLVMTKENCLLGDKLRMSLRQQSGVINATAAALGEPFSGISHVTAYRHRIKFR